MDSLSSAVFPMECLPRDDVLFRHILPLVLPEDWLRLMKTCRQINTIVKSFFITNKILNIQHCQNIGAEEFRILTENAKNLRILNTSGCTWLTDELLGPVLKNNQKINQLDLSHSVRCSPAVFQILTVSCPQVTKLVLRACPWVDQNSISYFYNHYSVRKPGQKLEDVLLNMSKGLRTNLKAKTKAKYRGKDKLFDVMKRKGEPRKGRTIKRFKNLLELDLNGCHQVTDNNIEALTGVFKYLEVLRLGSIPGLTDNSMKSIAIELKQLHTLDISFCSRISTAGVVTVLKHCSKLRTLEIETQQFKEDFTEFLLQKELNIRYKKTEERGESISMQASSSGSLLNLLIPSSSSSSSSLIPRSDFDGIVLGMTDVPGFSRN